MSEQPEQQLILEIESGRLLCDRFAIVESLPYFAQLMQNHRTLYGEVISNRYLACAERLTQSQERRLSTLAGIHPGPRIIQTVSATCIRTSR
jgi:hypothetical protein